jgi:hypothetical protein
MTAWVIISAVVLPLVLSEFSEVSPWLARHLLAWGAGRLGDPRACERYREEWQAGLDDVPGKLIKLIKALSILCCTVPALNWRFKGPVYLWPARKAVDTFLAIVRPSLCRRFREQRFYRYDAWVGKPGDAGDTSPSIMVGKLIELIKDVTTETAAQRVLVLPYSSSVSWNTYTVELDHRRRRLVIHGLRPGGKPATSRPISHR